MRQRGNVETRAHPVARDLGVHDPREAPAGDHPHQRVTRHADVGLPSARRHPLAARVDPRHDPVAETFGERARVVRTFDEQRPDHDGVRTGGEARLDILRRTHAATGLHRDVDGGADRVQRGTVLAASERSVEIDDVQRAGTRAHECPGTADRIGVVTRLARGISAFKPDRVPTAEVDRRIQLQRAAHPAAIARKLSMSRPPAVRLFSG